MKNNNYRPLTPEEIGILESQGCRADQWTNIQVTDSFTPERVREVCFYGQVRLGTFHSYITTMEGVKRPTGIQRAELHDVTVGNECLIENIHGYMAHYDIADGAYISDVGTLVVEKETTFGQGTRIHVLSESGDYCQVPLHRQLTAQIICLRLYSQEWRDILDRKTNEEMTPTRRGYVGKGACLCHTRKLKQVYVGDYATIDGAEFLEECYLESCEEAPVKIRVGVICRESIILGSAEIVDGAKVDHCFVGQAVHIGKGFSAESSLFFANCYMDNGESCAVCAGPYTVSHHKSTLLIGCMTSFFNAGSGTNMSNHMYKLGPLHHGLLERGCKTASGAHIVWGGHIGAFSMVMGKFDCHADLSCFPFSYIIHTDGHTMLIPGVNFATVGTYRDVHKWPLRDKRPQSPLPQDGISTYEELTPPVMEQLREGCKLLEKVREIQGIQELYELPNSVYITAKALARGIDLYRWIEQLYIARNVAKENYAPNIKPKEEWCDALGVIFPQKYIDLLLTSFKEMDTATGFTWLSGAFDHLRVYYPSFVNEHINHTYTAEEVSAAIKAYPDNLTLYFDRLIADARKEESFAEARTFIADMQEEKRKQVKNACAKAAN